MKLTANNIANIEMTVDENTVAEVRLTEEGALVTRRPVKEHDIQFPYPMQCAEDSPCRLNLSLQRSGDRRIDLGTFDLPANYWLEAIKGYQGEKKEAGKT